MNGESTLSREWGFRGKLLNVEVLSVDLGDGKTSTREVLRHPGAAVVLARLPDGRFVFVRQFRKAVEQFMLETIAGTREAGESPDVCARREVLEECGHGVVDMQKLGLTYPAPGYTDECLHLYLADVSAEAQALDTDDDEEIEVVYMSAEDVDAALVCGDIVDAKTMSIWWLYKQKGGGTAGAA